jgi:predicted amidohydrolase
MITEVFQLDRGIGNLTRTLEEARDAGAELAVLPELPLDRWFPISREPSDDDAEAPGGPRHRTLSGAAASTGIGVLGGAVVRDPDTGRRHNTALAFDSGGVLVGSYRKVHLPFEEGFWEAAHYEPGGDPPEVMGGFSLPIGFQICSDANRTSGSHLLAAQGAAVIFVPRATPAASWQRWKLILRANAVTSGAWVVTVNRPPLADVDSPIGGPSAAIAPDGEVACETTDTMAIVDLDSGSVARARNDYPGYLDFHPKVHASGWQKLGSDVD